MGKLSKYIGISLIACSAILVTQAQAENITKKLDLNEFSKINLDVPADLQITIGSEFSIIVTGNDERIENTNFEISGKTLQIDRKKKFFSFFGGGYKGKMDIAITMPDIEMMQIDGSGDATIIGVDNKKLELIIDGSGNLDVIGKSEYLEIEIDGSGDIDVEKYAGIEVVVIIDGSGDVDIEGQCERLNIEIDGSGDVHAKQLKSVDVRVYVDGSGDSFVYASGSLTFDGDGSGNVDIYGAPKEIIDNYSIRHSNIRIH